MQSLLLGKQHARSIENLVDALAPLVTNKTVKIDLQQAKAHATEADRLLQAIYDGNATEAFDGRPSLSGPQVIK